MHTHPLLPSFYRPARRVTNRVALGLALDRDTAPAGEDLDSLDMHAGKLAAGPQPARSAEGQLTPSSQGAETFASGPVRNGDVVRTEAGRPRHQRCRLTGRLPDRPHPLGLRVPALLLSRWTDLWARTPSPATTSVRRPRVDSRLARTRARSTSGRCVGDDRVSLDLLSAAPDANEHSYSHIGDVEPGMLASTGNITTLLRAGKDPRPSCGASLTT